MTTRRSGRTWDENFLVLLRFKKKYGTAHVPFTFPDRQLASWVFKNRTNKGSLSSEQLKKLEDVGFDFQLMQERNIINWNNKYEALKGYARLHGTCVVPTSVMVGDESLGHWVTRQRCRKKKGLLNEYRFEKLDAVGFAWQLSKPRKKKSNKKRQRAEGSSSKRKSKLRTSRKRTVDGAAVSAKSMRNGGRRMKRTNEDRHDGTAKYHGSAQRMSTASAFDEKQRFHFDDLSSSDSSASDEDDYDDSDDDEIPDLNAWAEQVLRRTSLGSSLFDDNRTSESYMYTTGTLLDTEFITEDPHEIQWQFMYRQLVRFLLMNGHCVVPSGYKYPDSVSSADFAKPVSLPEWVSEQRLKTKQGKLKKCHRQLLDQVGFVWRMDAGAAQILQEMESRKKTKTAEPQPSICINTNTVATPNAKPPKPACVTPLASDDEPPHMSRRRTKGSALFHDGATCQVSLGKEHEAMLDSYLTI